MGSLARDIGTPSHLRRLLNGGAGAEDGEDASGIPRVASVDQNCVPEGDGSAGPLVSTYNLTSTILGAGILSVPYAVAECGLVLGLVLLTVTAVCSAVSCNLVLSAYLRTGRGSYGDLALHLFGPRTSSLVSWVIIVLNVGAAAGYILVVKSLLPPSLCELAGHGSAFCGDRADALVTGAIVYLVVFPLCTMKNLSSLRHTSMLAFLFTVFLAVAIGVRAVTFEGPRCELRLLPENTMGLFRALPVFCFSFVCHLNVLPVYDQLHSRSPTKMRAVFNIAVVFAVILYGSAGALGYVRFSCGPVPGNVLAFGFFASDDPLIAAARIAEALTCTLALPLIQHPTRVALHSWLFNAPSVDDEGDDVEGPGLDEADNGYGLMPLIEESAPGNGPVPTIPAAPTAAGDAPATRCCGVSCSCSRAVERTIEALAIMTMAFTIAMVVPDVSTVFGLLGGTCCSLVVFILPGIYYLKCTQPLVQCFASGVPSTTKQAQSMQRVVRQRRWALGLVVVGVFVGVFGTAATALPK